MINLHLSAKELKRKLGIQDGQTPVKGVDYFDGERGPQGEPGREGPPGPPGASIKGDPGENGKDGSPDSPDQIRDKLESLDGDDRLDASAIRNLPEPEYNPVTKKYYYGGGGNKWAIGQSTTPGGTLTVSATAPANPQIGDLWVDIT